MIFQCVLVVDDDFWPELSKCTFGPYKQTTQTYLASLYWTVMSVSSVGFVFATFFLLPVRSLAGLHNTTIKFNASVCPFLSARMSQKPHVQTKIFRTCYLGVA